MVLSSSCVRVRNRTFAVAGWRSCLWVPVRDRLDAQAVPMSNDPAALPGAIAAFNSAVDQWFNQRSLIAVREATDAQIYGLDARTGVYHHPPENYGEELLAMHGALADRRNEIIRTGNVLVPLLARRGEDALAVAVQAVADAASDRNPSHIEQTRGDVKARLWVLAAKLGAAPALRPAERDWFGSAIKLFDLPPEAGTGEVVEVTQEGSKGPQPDGPFDADGFRFAGVEVRFGRAAKQYRLVLALWDVAKRRPADPRPIQDVIDEVWGEGNDTDDARFRSLCSEVRLTRFQPANCPLDIRPMQGKVQLVPL